MALGAALAVAAGCFAGAAAAQEPTGTPARPFLTLLTEDYPPYGYSKDGEILGSAVEQVRRIMADAGIDFSLDIVPWARAIGTAETDPATCAFSTTLLPERMARFKWVQPLTIDVLMLVGRTGGTAKPSTLAEAKALTIAVHRDDSGEVFARAENFPHIDSAPSLDLSLKKLIAGRVDLMLVTNRTLEDLRSQGQPIEAVLDVRENRSGLACNKAVPDPTIAALQAALDQMIADGTQAEIEHRYGMPAK